MQCSSCGGTFEQWRKHSRKCRECYNKYVREWMYENKDRVKASVLAKWENYSNQSRFVKYGLTETAFDDLRRKPPNCAICRTSFNDARLHIDHCHTTGRIRGLLCSRCNQGLGFFKDDPNLFTNAAKYLKDATN